MPTPQTTHFGYQTIPTAEKVNKVNEVFRSVADNYDLMNDLMSLGLHRLWKRFAIDVAMIEPHQNILDLASGTGDLAVLMHPKIKGVGQIVLSDINEAMLTNAKKRLIDQGILNNVSFVLANAEALPFEDNYFDRVTISFGLRNVTDKEKALSEMYRVLKPGGMCLVTEFSKPALPALSKIYDQYSFSILPKLGKLIANDEDSYRYLAESIRMHPDQEGLKKMMLEAGFETCDYFNLTGGIVALHQGYKS